MCITLGLVSLSVGKGASFTQKFTVTVAYMITFEKET